MEDLKFRDIFRLDKLKHCDILIDEERRRICEVKNAMQTQEKDLQCFAASVSLARLFKAQYRSRKHHGIKQISLRNIESEEVYFVIINILDLVLRIISLSSILELKDPNIFDEEQRDMK
jgi:hypothetical protein